MFCPCFPSAHLSYTVSSILLTTVAVFQLSHFGHVLLHVSECVPWVFLTLGDEDAAHTLSCSLSRLVWHCVHRLLQWQLFQNNLSTKFVSMHLCFYNWSQRESGCIKDLVSHAHVRTSRVETTQNNQWVSVCSAPFAQQQEVFSAPSFRGTHSTARWSVGWRVGWGLICKPWIMLCCHMGASLVNARE